MCLLIWVEVHYLSTNHYVWIADGQSLRDKQWINKDQPHTQELIMCTAESVMVYYCIYMPQLTVELVKMSNKALPTKLLKPE